MFLVEPPTSKPRLPLAGLLFVRPRVSWGTVPPPTRVSRGYPSRIKLGVPKIYKMQKSRRFEDLLLLCSLKLTDYSVFSPEVISQGVSVEALMDLRKRIDEMLLERRAEIEKQLERMGRAIAVVGSRGGSVLKGRKVPPKYRSPSGETWAGRGAKPRWLVAAIKRGKKLEDFLIDKSARKRRRRRRSRR